MADMMIPVEPERYELHTEPESALTLGRREFFKSAGLGLFVILILEDTSFAQQRGESGGGRQSHPVPEDIGAWLHIGEDGQITVYTGKAEVGQGIRTSLAQIVAEELRAPLSSVHLVMADTDLTPYDMGTFGSRTTPFMGQQLRKVSDAAREILVDLAAQQWNVDRASLTTADGQIADPATKRTVAYGALTKGQKLVKTITGDAPAIPAAEWKIAGTPAPKAGGIEFVTGRHRYTSDIKLPGMLYGKVLRPPAFHSTLVSLDTSRASAIPGVTVVRDGDFVGAVAPDAATAAAAILAMRAEWKTTPQPSSRDLYTYLKQHPVEDPRGSEAQTVGSIADGMARASQKLNATYTVAYIAHTPLEPRAAVAVWNNGKLNVWTGSQRPFGVRTELATAFGLPETSVRVVVPDTGAAYGGKHTGEAAVEAARLAKAAGKPVKLNWTREEEFTWAYFRPSGVIDVSSGVQPDGTITAWEFHNYNSGSAGIETPYDIPNKKIQFHPTEMPLRQGSYRALAATANQFARESHMDELAHAVGMDPVQFRYHNLKDARVRAVLEAAANRIGWGGAALPAGRALGIAAGTEKGGYISTAAEVAVDPVSGGVTVLRLVTAFECGAIVNPDLLTNQIQGAAMMGLGGALFEAIAFEDGKIMNPHLALYRVPRFSDLPSIEVVLLDRKDLPSAGAGEAPIVCVAPAIANAVFHATGVRIRSMPLVPSGLAVAFSGAGGSAV